MSRSPPSDRRPPSAFRGRVNDGGAFALAAGRYRLIASYACPFAHRTLLARSLTGLEEAVPLLALEPVMDDQGWRLPPEEGGGHLLDLYRSADPGYDGRATVPVLQDMVSGAIVSNDSGEIMRSLEQDFAPLAQRAAALVPAGSEQRIDRCNAWIHRRVNDQMYRIAFAPDPATASARRRDLYRAFSRLDLLMSGRETLLGTADLTECDLRLWPTLARFDIAYRPFFGAGPEPLSQWPNLSSYFKRLLAIPEVARTFRPDHIEQHFRARARQLSLRFD